MRSETGTKVGADSTTARKARDKNVLGWAAVTIVTLLTGLMFSYTAWTKRQADRAMWQGGIETVARVVSATERQGKQSQKSYAIALAWNDKAGQRRESPPRHVSPAYWNRIVSNGTVIVRDVWIRYLEDRPDVLPVVLDDRQDYEYQFGASQVAGSIFLVIGFGLVWVTVWRAYVARQRN